MREIKAVGSEVFFKFISSEVVGKLIDCLPLFLFNRRQNDWAERAAAAFLLCFEGAKMAKIPRAWAN